MVGRVVSVLSSKPMTSRYVPFGATIVKWPCSSVVVVSIGVGEGPGTILGGGVKCGALPAIGPFPQCHGSSRTATPASGAPDGSSTNVPVARVLVGSDVTDGLGSGVEP